MDGLRRRTRCRLGVPFPFPPGHIAPASLRFTIIQLRHRGTQRSLSKSTTNAYWNQDIRLVHPEANPDRSRPAEKRDRSMAQYLLPHWFREGCMPLNWSCGSNQHRIQCKCFRRRLARRRYKASFIGLINVQTELKSCKSTFIWIRKLGIFDVQLWGLAFAAGPFSVGDLRSGLYWVWQAPSGTDSRAYYKPLRNKWQTSSGNHHLLLRVSLYPSLSFVLWSSHHSAMYSLLQASHSSTITNHSLSHNADSLIEERQSPCGGWRKRQSWNGVSHGHRRLSSHTAKCICRWFLQEASRQLHASAATIRYKPFWWRYPHVPFLQPRTRTNIQRQSAYASLTRRPKGCEVQNKISASANALSSAH